MPISISANTPINQVNFSAPNFKGKYERTQNGNPYYKTNSGIKIGGFFATLSLLTCAAYKSSIGIMEKMNEKLSQQISSDNLISPEQKKNLEKYAEEQKKMVEQLKKTPFSKIFLPALGIAAVHLLAGYVADNYRNKKSAEASDKIAQYGYNRASYLDDNIELSRNNRPYLRATDSAKIGIASGIAAGSAIHLLNRFTYDSMKIRSGILSNIIFGALGGWMLTAMANNFANKDAEKHA